MSKSVKNIVAERLSAPFGYRSQAGNLVINENEAPIRKLMYELFLTHGRKKTVARLLNEQGFKTRNRSSFSDSTVQRLLQDTSAKGLYLFTEKGVQKSLTIEPIVPPEIWEQANALLKSTQKPLKKTVNLLAGLIYCECGGRMAVPSNSPKYICESCRRKIEKCDIEEIFREQLAAFPLDIFGFDSRQQISATSERILKTETLKDYWQAFGFAEQRLLVEQIVRRVIVGKRDISFEFGILPNSKLPVFEQQNLGVKTPETSSVSEKEITREVIKPPENEKSESLSLKEPLLNETDAAKFLGISRMTLLRKRNSGEICFFRVGFRVLYSKEKHLGPFLAKCEQKGNL